MQRCGRIRHRSRGNNRQTLGSALGPVFDYFREGVVAYWAGQERLVGEIGFAGVLALETLCGQRRRRSPIWSPPPALSLAVVLVLMVRA
jgi:hypothetical protein